MKRLTCRDVGLDSEFEWMVQQKRIFEQGKSSRLESSCHKTRRNTSEMKVNIRDSIKEY